MKKKIISIISILLLTIMLFSCAPSTGRPAESTKIPQEHIYELAVKSGYDGTYEEWLASIKGENGKDGRNVELSTTPTHIVWRYEDSTEWKTLVALKDLQGTDGKSAYELAKDYGYKGTIEEWLESLKGTNGTNGTNGVDGKQIELSTNTTHIVWKYTEDSEWNNLVSLELLKGATTSITGAAGKSAYEIAVDLGYKGTVNEWIESLKGQNGHTPVITIKEGYWYVDGVSTNVKAEGKDGNGILNFELSKQDGLKDTYTITFTDNTTKEFTVTNGKDGVDGVSISNVDLTSEGNLEVTLSSGITLNLGKVKGEDGIDGTSIKEANINTDGHLILTLTDESEINVGKIVGDKGDQGINGIGIKSIAFDSDNNLIITLTDDTEVNCGKVPTCNHIFSEWTNEIKATCTSIGVDTRECTICEMKDYKFTEELDHKFNEWSTLVSTCTEHKESRICSECNKVELRDGEINKDNHNFNNGICDNCGESNVIKYKVIFNANNETPLEEVEVEEGKKVSEPEEPIKEGYNFIGWYLNDEKWSFKGYVVTENITLVAKWEEKYTFGLEFSLLPDGTYGVSCGSTYYLYDIVIPSYYNNEKVTMIIDEGFKACKNMESISIPNTVTSINDYAFYNCTNLKNISIPAGLTYLGQYAFAGCIRLAEIEIDAKIEELAEHVFSGCLSLSRIKIAESVKVIKPYAFYACENVEEILIEGSSTWSCTTSKFYRRNSYGVYSTTDFANYTKEYEKVYSASILSANDFVKYFGIDHSSIFRIEGNGSDYFIWYYMQEWTRN